MNPSEKSERGPPRSGDGRADRLARALQANISRRKAQARGRNVQNDSQLASDNGPAGMTDTSARKDEP